MTRGFATPPSATPASAQPRTSSPDAMGVELVQSNVARATADPRNAKAAATSIEAFGLDLYRALLADPALALAKKNVVFSPTGIALALAMARAGAKGETASQATFTDAAGNPQVTVALWIANVAYGQGGWKIEQPCLDAIAGAFGAGPRLVDFAADPERARKSIDAWVSEQMGGRIRELLQPGDLTPLTRLVLANATYLKAEWEWWFEQSETKSAPSTRLDGRPVDVPTMRRLGPIEGAFPIPYVSGTGWQAVELRYKSAEGSSPLAVTLILPTDLAGFEKGLTAAQLTRITTDLAQQRRTSVRIGPCTGTRVDFTGIHAPSEIWISLVMHQATINVDEKGTEAAAATALGGMGGAGGPMPQRQITLCFDHPFLFVLHDVETGAVLFMGQVTDPSEAKGG